MDGVTSSGDRRGEKNSGPLGPWRIPVSVAYPQLVNYMTGVAGPTEAVRSSTVVFLTSRVCLGSHFKAVTLP